MKRRLLTYLLFILTGLAANAQDITVEAEYPSVVEAGQQFSVSWTVNSGGGQFTAPSFQGFYKLMGPQTSYSSSTQIINGKMSHQTSYSYTYYLQAMNEGVFVIEPATFTLKNKSYYSDSLRIEVVGRGRPASGARTGDAEDQDDGSEGNVRGDLFLNLSVNKRSVYVGEPIVASVKIYTRVDLSGINEVKYPAFTSFLRTDLETPALNSLRQENVNGTIYGTGVIQQFLLYPQVSGQITIDPVQITVLVQQRTGNPDPFFGDFFATYQSVPRAVASRPVTINVRPLPGTKPDDFSGVVGKLSIKSGINKDSVNVNDAVNYRITVSGTGNLKLAGAPVLKLSPDIEVYDPKITDDIKNSTSGTSGQRTFEYLLIPRHYGDFTIPPVTYSYFNSSTGKYEKLTTEGHRFHARKGTDQNAGITVYGGVSKENVKYVGKDIRFIKTSAGKLVRSSNIILSNRSFYSGYAIALIAFFTILFLRREHIRRNADITAVKNRKAGKIAVQRLREAAACMKRNEIDRFHEEILKAIWGYLGDKLNIPASDLSRNNVSQVLRERGIPDETIQGLTELLDSCEFARYAPSASGTEAAHIYEKASAFIRTIENSTGGGR
ncbi:MAG TPA: BatD family protein [Bacteroidales bacterium]|nr:BatD family protein [Bacteroidales bacterium]